MPPNLLTRTEDDWRITKMQARMGNQLGNPDLVTLAGERVQAMRCPGLATLFSVCESDGALHLNAYRWLCYTRLYDQSQTKLNLPYS